MIDVAYLKNLMEAQKDEEISRLKCELQRKDKEIKILKGAVDNWKQRYIGVCLSSRNKVDEDEADAFADTIKEMEC